MECINLLERYLVKHGYFWHAIVENWKNLQIIVSGLRLLLLEAMINTLWKLLFQCVCFWTPCTEKWAEIGSIVLFLLAIMMIIYFLNPVFSAELTWQRFQTHCFAMLLISVITTKLVKHARKMPFFSFYKAKYKPDAQENGKSSITCCGWVCNQVILISVHDLGTK